MGVPPLVELVFRVSHEAWKSGPPVNRDVRTVQLLGDIRKRTPMPVVERQGYIL